MKNRIRILGLLFAAVTAISLIPLYLFTAKAEGTPEHTAPITEKPVYVTVTDEAGASVSGANVQVLDPDGNVVKTLETSKTPSPSSSPQVPIP